MAGKSGGATLDDVLKQLKTLNRLFAAQLKAQVGQMELVGLLADSGLTAREIGEVLGTTPATVAVTLQRIRDKRRKKME